MADEWPLFDDNGEDFERPNPVSRWRAPLSVSLQPSMPGACETEVLTFDYAEPSADPERWCEVEEGLLRSFARLADAPAPRIVGFAQRWGALSLMGIGYRRHSMTNMPGPPEAPGIVWESVVEWRWAAHVVYRVLKLSAHLRKGFVFEDDDVNYLRRDSLSIVYDVANWNTPDEQAAVRETARAYVERMVNGWLRAARIVPVLKWEERPAFSLHAHSVGAALGLQLALATIPARGFIACNGCGELFWTTHQPRRDRQNFCPTCQENKESRRIAGLSYRERKRTGEESRHPRKHQEDSPLGSGDI